MGGRASPLGQVERQQDAADLARVHKGGREDRALAKSRQALETDRMGTDQEGGQAGNLNCVCNCVTKPPCANVNKNNNKNNNNINKNKNNNNNNNNNNSNSNG